MWTPIILAVILAAVYLLLRRVTAWRREIARGLRLERNGEAQEAERILRGILERSKAAPDSLRHTVAGFHLGAFLMRARRYREAMELLREPLGARLDTENELTIRSMIRTALEALGMPDLAEDEERRMSELISSIQDASLQAEWRGQLLLEQARPDEAAEHFRTSVERAPPRQLGRVVVRALKAANACLLAGRYEEGAEAARHTIELRPPPLQMAMAYSILASANTSIGNLDKAETAAREARRLAEETGDENLRARSLAQLATVSFYRGDYDKAYAASRTIEDIDLETARAEMHLLQGEILRYKGDFGAALDAYTRSTQEAIERHTGYAESNLEAAATIAAAWAEFERGNGKEALSKIDSVARIRRTFPLLKKESTALRAVFLAALGLREESEAEIQRAMTMCGDLPDSKPARISRAAFAGLQSLLLDQPEKAADKFRAALAESPPPKDRPRLHFHLARALASAGHTEEASDELERASEGPAGDHYSRKAKEELSGLAS